MSVTSPFRSARTALALAVVLGLAGPVAPYAAESARDSIPPEPVLTRAEVQRMLEALERRLPPSRPSGPEQRFRFSGYMQARFEVGEASSDTVRVIGAPPVASSSNVSRFFIRRARVKLTVAPGPRSEAVISVDGSQDRTVRVLDAALTLKDAWTPNQAHRLTIGQFEIPFGFELERSSSVRELPERSRAENVLFSGERDRGLKLENRWSPKLTTVAALLNGGGFNDPDFPNSDPTRGKDFCARARWSEKTVQVAASYSFGRDVVPLSGPDAWTERERMGADAQWSYKLPQLGSGSLMAELYAGTETNPDSVRALVATVSASGGQQARLLRPGADPAHLATPCAGGYVLWVQEVAPRVQLAVRHDRFDPNTDAARDDYARWSFGLNTRFDEQTRLSVAYDAIRTHVATAGGGFRDPADNLWTFQAQFRF